MLPEFLGDKRHEWMQQTQQRVEEVERGIHCSAIDWLAICGLHNLEIPSRELLPEQAVYGHQRVVQSELAEEVLDFGDGSRESSAEPLNGEARVLWLLHVVAHLPSLHQTETVPDLVVEVSSLLAQSVVEEDVVTGRGAEHHTHAHTVGTVFVDKHQRVGAVSERLRHLSSQLVAHHTSKINVAERHVAGVLVSSHNHACHPEEDDVGGCHQVGRGIVVVDFLVTGIVNTVEERDGPQPRAEPSVESVLVLTQIGCCKILTSRQLASFFQRLISREGHDKTLLLAIAGGQEISRNAVSPP